MRWLLAAKKKSQHRLLHPPLWWFLRLRHLLLRRLKPLPLLLMPLAMPLRLLVMPLPPPATQLKLLAKLLPALPLRVCRCGSGPLSPWPPPPLVLVVC